MNVELVIANHLRVAAEDLKGARVLTSAKNRNASYLLAQAAEKVIIAVLTAEGAHAGIRHQLDEMVKKVPDANPLKADLAALQKLQDYATSWRYPTERGRIRDALTEREFADFAKSVEAALQKAAAAFGVDLTDPNAPAKTKAPPR